MKKFFQEPEMEVEVLSVLDVITASYEMDENETPGV